MKNTDGVSRATGRGRDEWFALLDEWGAAGREYGVIAGWLTGEHGLSRWWAQKLIVEYEQARGIRPPGVRRDGTFEVSASKTVKVSVDRLYDAFADLRQRKEWLTKGSMSLTSSQDGRSARFDWADGSSRVNATFEAKGPGKAMVAVAHARLGDESAAQAAKAMWKEALADLDSFLTSRERSAPVRR